MPLPKLDRYTYADLLAWPEEVRAELIDGDLYMLASPSVQHQSISMDIGSQIAAYLRGKTCKVFAAPFDVRLFEQENDPPHNIDTVVQPDLSVICDPSKLDSRGCKGAPDLVVEILSPSTMQHDRVVKFNLYREAGVREYWIVDPESQTLSVYTLENGQYYAAQTYSPNAPLVSVGVLEDCTIDLKTVFA